MRQDNNQAVTRYILTLNVTANISILPILLHE